MEYNKSQMHVIGKHEKANAADSMTMCTQQVIGHNTLTKIINTSFYGAYGYKEGVPTDGLECHINKHWTIEELRKRLKEADINTSDEMVQKMFDEIIKAQTEHGIDNDSLIE